MQASRAELERAVLERMTALLDDPSRMDSQFLEGQRAAIAAAIEYGFTAIELGERRLPEVPSLFHARARQSARSGIPLNTMLRRYFAGYVLLTDFLMREAGQCGLRGETLQGVMRDIAAAFDRLVSTVTDEYVREADIKARSREVRTEARVRALLDGELIDTEDFNYEFDDAWHLGALALGEGASEALHDLARSLDYQSLVLAREDEPVWAWFGGRAKIEFGQVEKCLEARWPQGLPLALGEPAQGLSGWRLTHRQALAVLPVAKRSADPYTRYGEAALIASVLQDDLLAVSLRELYLRPLEGGRDGGEALRQTLRAYFSSDRNVPSAAAALGVSRRTVTNRLRSIETRIERTLGTVATEVDAALRLHDLQDHETRRLAEAADGR